MAKIRKLVQNNEDLYPITHETAVFDNNGVDIGTKIENIENDMINLVDIDEIYDVDGIVMKNGVTTLLENVGENVIETDDFITIQSIKGCSYVENKKIYTVENNYGLEIRNNHINNNNLFSFSNIGLIDKYFNIPSRNSIDVGMSTGRYNNYIDDKFIPVGENKSFITCYKTTINEPNTHFIICYDENYNILTDLTGVGSYVSRYNGYIQKINQVYTYPENVKYIRLGFRSLPLNTNNTDDLSTNFNINEFDYCHIYDVGIYNTDSLDNIDRNDNIINSNFINLNYNLNNIKELHKINDNLCDKIQKEEGYSVYEKKCIKHIFDGTEKIIEALDFSTNENVASFYILINKPILQSEEIEGDINLLCSHFSYTENIEGNDVEGCDYLHVNSTDYSSIGFNVCRGICIHINKSSLSDVSVDGMRAFIEEQYEAGTPLTIIAACINEKHIIDNITFFKKHPQSVISVNSLIKPEIDVLICEIIYDDNNNNSVLLNKVNINHYASLFGLTVLSDEIKKTGKSIQDIITEKKRILVDKMFYLNERIKLVGNGFFIQGIPNNNTGFTQLTEDEPVIQLGENGEACNDTTITDINLLGYFTDFSKLTGSGLLINFAYSVTFNKITCRHNKHGVEGLYESNKNGLWIAKFTNCVFSNNRMDGVHFKHINDTQFNDIVFDKCTVQANGYFINDENMYVNARDNNETLTEYGHGYNVSGTGIKIINGDSEGNGAAGIKINEGHASGITISGMYLEPNLLTNLYFCKDGVKKNLSIHGNYFMTSNDYLLGPYYVEEGFDNDKFCGTQLYDYSDLIKSSKISLNQTVVNDGSVACVVALTEKMLNQPLNIKLTMRYKSLIEHGYMSFGVEYKMNSHMVRLKYNRDTLKSNVSNITSIVDNVIYVDDTLVPVDDTWDYIVCHNHNDYIYDYEGGFASSVDVFITKENMSISDDGLELTFNDLTTNQVNLLKNCTHVSYHKKDVVTGSLTDYIDNYVKIPVSMDKYNNILSFSSIMETEKYSEARLYITDIFVWGVPYSYQNINHELYELKIEQTDIAYARDTSHLDALIKYDYMRIFIFNSCTYVTYYNGKYYKDDGTELTV